MCGEVGGHGVYEARMHAVVEEARQSAFRCWEKR